MTLVPLDPVVHTPRLFESLAEAPESLWTYMSIGPFQEVEDLRADLVTMSDNPDWSPYAILVDDVEMGFASYLRVKPHEGVIEIGSIVFSPGLQRSTAATEALYLMIENVFDLGYRRCEWKCDALNQPSRSAAARLGFTFEGVFRNATHYKGRNRDTAWYAIIAEEWPEIRRAFNTWLAPENFDENGRQRRSLVDVREGK